MVPKAARTLTSGPFASGSRRALTWAFDDPPNCESQQGPDRVMGAGHTAGHGSVPWTSGVS